MTSNRTGPGLNMSGSAASTSVSRLAAVTQPSTSNMTSSASCVRTVESTL